MPQRGIIEDREQIDVRAQLTATGGEEVAAVVLKADQVVPSPWFPRHVVVAAGEQVELVADDDRLAALVKVPPRRACCADHAPLPIAVF
jgi:hypothetical protein